MITQAAILGMGWKKTKRSSGRPLRRRDDGWDQHSESGGRNVSIDLLTGKDQKAEITIQLDVLRCLNSVFPIIYIFIILFCIGT